MRFAPVFIALCLSLVGLVCQPLVAQDFTPVGVIELQSQLKGVAYLDGVKTKVVREGMAFAVQQVPVGRHVLEVEGDGGKIVFRQVVEVAQGKALTVTLAKDPELDKESSYSNVAAFTANYRSPFEKLKKGKDQLIVTIQQQIENQQFDAAQSALTAWLAEDAEDAIPNYYVGELTLAEALEVDDETRRNQLLEKAKGHFEKGTSKSKPFAFSFAGMAYYHALRREMGPMVENAYLAEQLDGENVPLLVKIAEAFTASRSRTGSDNATRVLTKASALAPEDANILVALGNIYLAQSIEETPKDYYEQALTKDPNNVRAYYRLGQYYVGERKYSEANKALTKAQELDPSFAPVYSELGELYSRIPDYAKAKDYYRKYVELRSGDLSARYRYTLFLYLSKDYKTGVTEIQTVLQDTSTSVLLRLLTYCAVESGDLALAKDAFERYQKSWAPNELIAKDYEYRGKIKLAAGDAAGGTQDLLYCVELDPSRTDLLTYLVNSYGREKKDYATAASYQARLVAIEPTLTNYNLLASLYNAAKDTPNALATYQKMAELFPDNLGVWALLADKQWEIDRADPDNPQYLAKPYFDKVIELGGADPEKKYTKQLTTANFYQAYYAYLIEEDREKAIAFCDKTLALDPNYTTAKELKKQCLEDLGRK